MNIARGENQASIGACLSRNQEEAPAFFRRQEEDVAMITRAVRCPVAIAASPGILQDCAVKGVRIVMSPEQPGQVTITAPNEAAADAAEVWLAEMDAPSH
ncbi:hypothetical protein IAI58_03825 [Roseomonas marmotae]|uniref:hypothetical protein n=1 Tax=Roseomonas marmotae TaxID=2768161 RepID=UPI001AD71505|nr:hypothetical protein [Roseomonas marmotae]QTI79922.1 hypothetical protein IAI58_03825 [Roseomonas marmotae]